MAKPSLAARTRAVAEARAPSGTDPLLVIAGLGAVALGVAVDMLPVAVAGAAAVGWSFRPEHERSYLEGFADGLRFFEADDGAGQPPGPGGDRADVRGLPDGAGEDDHPAAAGPGGPAGGGTPGAGGAAGP